QCRVFSGTTNPQRLCRVPDARHVTPRRQTAGLLAVVCGPPRRDVIPFLVLCAQKRRDHPCCHDSHDRSDQALGHFRTLLALIESQAFCKSAFALPYCDCLNSLPLITIRPLTSPTGCPFFAWL